MERMFERDVIPLCQALNIGFVAFSPLASGFLSGKVRSDDRYQGDDVRRGITGFDAENVKANQPLVALPQKLSQKKGADAGADFAGMDAGKAVRHPDSRSPQG